MREIQVVSSSKQWSNDKWLKNQEERKFINNEGMKVIKERRSRRKNNRWKFVHVKSITRNRIYA